MIGSLSSGFRQGQLHQDAVDRRIGVEGGDESCQFLLPGLGRQRVLDGLEAAFLGHAALGADIGVACRVVADDDDGQAGGDATALFQRRRRTLDRLND